jgi:hypothetical protein
MTDRAERDQNRSDEAHWQVAEAGAEAEENDEAAEAGRRLGDERQEQGWDNEGGALQQEP